MPSTSVPAAHAFSFNHGQTCCAGSRIFVQRKIYDEFAKKFAEVTKKLKVGDPFEQSTYQGPQVSQVQYDRIMNYVECGKEEGATVITGGKRHGKTGFFIEPVSTTLVPHRLLSFSFGCPQDYAAAGHPLPPISALEVFRNNLQFSRCASVMTGFG